MTTKQQVDLETYRKDPRLLAKPMESALGFGGDLHPILVAVANDDRLRLDIRDHYFNVYYGGGSLMRVTGRKSRWMLRFDEKYFKDSDLQPKLPVQFSTIDDARTWVQAFPALIAGMEDWWTRNPKGERTHCQAMAAANSGMAGFPPADYLVLDLEYQWDKQRRFDLVAAKRKPTENDATGWAEPDFVFVEVKSAYNACSGTSGLVDHAQDYQNIITSSNGRHVKDIKLEYENVIAQKTRLRLLDKSLGFRRFSPAVPELLVVFVNLNPNTRSVKEPLKRVSVISGILGDSAQIRFMRLTSPNYVMTADNAVSVERLVAGNT